MDGISDILSRKDFDMPPEARTIKDYVRRHYDAEIQVMVQPRTIIISARSAGLTATLRLNARTLQKAAGTEKKLVFRIG